ncbi:MAG: tetratricopeptide repeat protein, partial [Chloroflexota bacterium]
MAKESRRQEEGPQEKAERLEILQGLRQRLAKDPRNVALLNDVGLAAEQVGDFDRARWAYKRAIRLDPGYKQSYRNLGLLYRREGREGPAMEALEKYIQWAGEDAELEIVEATASRSDQESETEAGISLADTPIYARLNQVWDEMGLTPAEAMMLLDPESSDGLQMLQYTLLDLVARGVLEADKKSR